MVHIETEIAASPAQVRSVFLDFSRYPEWHTFFIKSIETDPPNKPTVEKGDILNCYAGTELKATVVANSPTEFRWYGSTFAGAFAGEHYFIFNESKTTPGHTTFVHGEDHAGWMGFMFKPGWPLNKTVQELFTNFSQDLKTRAEDLYSGTSGV